MDLQDVIINAWREYGVVVEQDGDGRWTWAEIDENGEENGPFSSPFKLFFDCVGDLEACFGSLEEHEIHKYIANNGG